MNIMNVFYEQTMRECIEDMIMTDVEIPHMNGMRIDCEYDERVKTVSAVEIDREYNEYTFPTPMKGKNLEH